MHSDRRGVGLPPLGNGMMVSTLPIPRHEPTTLLPTIATATAGDMTPVHLPRRLVFDSAERTGTDSSPYASVAGQSPSMHASGVSIPPPTGPPPPPWSQSQLQDSKASLDPGPSKFPPRPPTSRVASAAPTDEQLWTEPRNGHGYHGTAAVSNATPPRTPNGTGTGTGGLQSAAGSGQGGSLSNSGKELSEVQRALKEAQRGVDVIGDQVVSAFEKWLQLLAPLESAVGLDPSLRVLVKERRLQDLADHCSTTPKLVPSITEKALHLVGNLHEADALQRQILTKEEALRVEAAALDQATASLAKVDTQLQRYPANRRGHQLRHPSNDGPAWSDQLTRVEATLRSELLAKEKDLEHHWRHSAKLLSSTVSAEKQIRELVIVTEERSASLALEGRRLHQSRLIALVSLEESTRFAIMDDESQAALLLWDSLARSIAESLETFDASSTQGLEQEVAQAQRRCDAATSELDSKRQILQGLSRQLQAFRDEESLRKNQGGHGKNQAPVLPAEWIAAFRQMPPEERETQLNQWRAKVREIQDTIALRPKRPSTSTQTPSRGPQTPSKPGKEKDDFELFETLDKLQSQVLHLSAELASIQREQQRCEGYQSIELYHDAQKALLDLHTTTINPLRAELNSLEQESKGIKKETEDREVERAHLMQTETSRRQAVDAKRSAKYALEDDIQQLEGTLNGLQSRRDQYLQKKKFYFAQMSRPDYMQLPLRSRKQIRGSSTDEAQHQHGEESHATASDQEWDREALDVDQSIEIVDGSPVAKVRGPWSGTGATGTGARTSSDSDFLDDRQVSRRLKDEGSTSRSSASVILGAAAWLGSTVASLWSRKAK